MKFLQTIAAALILSTLVVLGAVAQRESPAGEPEVWGGPHASLVMSKANTTLEFDCAQGVIMNPIQPDADGNFTARGTFTPQRGGPVQKDAPPRDLPATYQGSIHGNTMQLQVVLEDKAQEPPAMTLTRGQPGRVVKCK